jgi:hypothetical protein
MGKGSTCAGLLLPYHCVTALFCHAGARPVSCSSLREAFLVAPRARSSRLLLCHCVTAFFCHAGARPLVACSPPLAALRDSLNRDPAARPVPGPLGVRMRRRHRHPVAVRALGPRGLGRHGRSHPPGGLNTTTRKTRGIPSSGSDPDSSATSCRSFANGRVVVKSAPRATRAIVPKRAGTEPPDRRAETLTPTERFMRGRGTARVRTSGCACSVAREGGSEGCARCAARATAHSPWGKKDLAERNQQTAG